MNAILFLVPVPTAPILHPETVISETMTTFHGSLWGNKHGNPRFFFQVFARNSLINNIFEEEKSLIVEQFQRNYLNRKILKEVKMKQELIRS